MSFIDEIVAEQERIDAGVRSYIESLGQPDTFAAAIAERNFWVEEACRFSRNEEYYRGLLDQIAAHLGPDAYTALDGSVSDSPVRAKLPELVEALVKSHA